MESVKKGDRISLAKAPFFFLNGFEVNLRRGIEETVVIPNNVDDKTLVRIGRSIMVGDICLGWPKGKGAKIPEENIGDILEQGRNKVNDFLSELAFDKGIKDSDKISKLEKLLDIEKKDKNRKSVTLVIERHLSNIGGVSTVVEEETEKVEIELIKGTEEKESE